MPLVDLNFEDLYILATAYKKKVDELSSKRRRLALLNGRLEKIVSDSDKDFVKDHNYINQDILINDIKRVDDLLIEVERKQGYFTKACGEAFTKGVRL